MNERICPIPPGTPEARAAIERVRQRLTEEEARATAGMPWAETKRRLPNICQCGRVIRKRGNTRCWYCRQRRETSNAQPHA